MRAVDLSLALALLAPPAPAATPMIEIPEGPFRMGGDSGPADERPAHEAVLSAFSIDRTPVTNADFAQFLDSAGARGAKGERYFDDDDPDARIHRVQGRWRADSGYEDHPVVEVPWRGAREYCARQGKRLPTEAEWERAARGGIEEKDYPNGDTITPKDARFNAADGPVAVAKSAPNAFGLYDMAGNVAE